MVAQRKNISAPGMVAVTAYIPVGLKAELERIAQEESRTLTNVMTTLLASGVARSAKVPLLEMLSEARADKLLPAMATWTPPVGRGGKRK